MLLKRQEKRKHETSSNCLNIALVKYTLNTLTCKYTILFVENIYFQNNTKQESDLDRIMGLCHDKHSDLK